MNTIVSVGANWRTIRPACLQCAGAQAKVFFDLLFLRKRGKLTDRPSGMIAVRGNAGKGFLSPDFLRRRGKLTDHPSGMFAMRGSAGKGFLLPTFLFLKKKSTEEKYG